MVTSDGYLLFLKAGVLREEGRGLVELGYLELFRGSVFMVRGESRQIGFTRR
jgi:hypothetical protein